MDDLTGALVTTIRDNAAVAAITSRVRGGELAQGDAAPAVTVVMASRSRSPGGAGKARMGMQQATFYINCYATTYPAAAQLAGAVSDAVHLLSNKVISGKTIRIAIHESEGGPVLDPTTHWVTETLSVGVIGHA